MAIRNIIQLGDPTLRKKSFEVTDFGKKTAELLDDMKDTLFDANGAGLAAPQVAVLKRVALVDTEDGFYELINPVIKSMKGEQTGLEGCLSVKGKYGTVTRANDVTVIAQDRYGKKHTYKVSGFTARAFQHEIDHLDGIVYTSKCSDLMDDEE